MVPTESTACLLLGRIYGTDNIKHGMMCLCVRDCAMLQQHQLQQQEHDQTEHCGLLLKARH